MHGYAVLTAVSSACALASRLLDRFTRAVFTWQRRQARSRGVADPRTGGVTAVQRFGGAINLNVHFHTLVPDGVFDVEGAGPPRFVPVPPPGDEELAAILDRIVRRTAKALVGYDDVASEDDARADLLKKVFAVDVRSCPDCGGRLQIIAFIADDAVARRILLHLGLDSRGPSVARA